MNWSNYANFQAEEFNCSFSGKNQMKPEFLDILQEIRYNYGKPMIISSGYRDAKHPIEAAKNIPGEHSFGVASDIAIFGTDAIALLETAIIMGIKRIGLNQKGDKSKRFIHLGIGDKHFGFPQALWTYP